MYQNFSALTFLSLNSFIKQFLKCQQQKNRGTQNSTTLNISHQTSY